MKQRREVTLYFSHCVRAVFSHGYAFRNNLIRTTGECVRSLSPNTIDKWYNSCKNNARTRLSSPRRNFRLPTNQQDRFHSLVESTLATFTNFTRKIVTNVDVIDSRRRAPEARPGTPSSNIQICKGNFPVPPRGLDDEGRQKTGTRSRRIYTDLYLATTAVETFMGEMELYIDV
mgnify:CR=1 FL=1